MKHADQLLAFNCEGERLFGVLTRPSSPSNTVVVIVVGGPQYRVGSHRQFVHLARHLASAGVNVLRFDHRGIGDSGGSLQTFENLVPDIEAAIVAARQAVSGCAQVVLWGLCDGASAALMYVQQTDDMSVVALCLANPWVRSELTLARLHVRHYYVRRLLDAAFWKKLAGGQVAFSTIGHLLRSLLTIAWQRGSEPIHGQTLPFQERMAQGWMGFRGDILLLLSTNDYTAKEFLAQCRTDPSWRGALSRPGLSRIDIPDSDHTFSSSASKALVATETARWLARIWPP